MKKMITLALAAGCFTIALAQPPRPDYGKNHRDDRRYENAWSQSLRQRDEQIQRINKQFDYQVRNVQADPYLRRNQKRKIFQRLESDRRRQINEVYARFNNRRNGNQQPYAYRY